MSDGWWRAIPESQIPRDRLDVDPAIRAIRLKIDAEPNPHLAKLLAERYDSDNTRN